MAVNNTAKKYSGMEFPLAMKRQDAFALDPSTVWPTLADIGGRMLSVVVNGTATPYVIQNANGDLAPLGAAAVTIASDDEANEMLTEVFGE